MNLKINKKESKGKSTKIRVTLPYVRGVSEALRRDFRHHWVGLPPSMKPHMTLKFGRVWSLPLETLTGLLEGWRRQLRSERQKATPWTEMRGTTNYHHCTPKLLVKKFCHLWQKMYYVCTDDADRPCLAKLICRFLFNLKFYILKNELFNNLN